MDLMVWRSNERSGWWSKRVYIGLRQNQSGAALLSKLKESRRIRVVGQRAGTEVVLFVKLLGGSTKEKSVFSRRLDALDFVDSETLKEEPDTRPINNEVNQSGLRKRSGMCRRGHGKESLFKKEGREGKWPRFRSLGVEDKERRESGSGRRATLKRNEVSQWWEPAELTRSGQTGAACSV